MEMSLWAHHIVSCSQSIGLMRLVNTLWHEHKQTMTCLFKSVLSLFAKAGQDHDPDDSVSLYGMHALLQDGAKQSIRLD